MAVTLGSNNIALAAVRRLDENSRGLQKTNERLASGLRINTAADDAAGLAIASTLNSNSRVYSQGVRNINDAISALAISEGGLGELSEVATRLRELATQAANGSYSLGQRRSNDAEADALVDEYNRLISSTSFNGLSLYSRSMGGLRVQAGFGVNGSLSFNLNGSLKRYTGQGTFGSASTINAPQILSSVLASPIDVNGDGKNDIVAASAATAQVIIKLGNGDGTFVDGSSFASTNASGVTQGDFNGDGRPDLVVTSSAGLTIFLNNGSGGFSASGSAQADLAFGVLSGDVNGDGKQDILSYDDNTSAYSVFLGNGNGTFKTTQSLGFTPTQVALGDLNSDGILDLVSTAAGALVTVRLGNGDATFKSAQNYGISGPAASSPIGLADLNDDGVLDVTVETSLGFSVLLANQDGTLQAMKNTSYASSIGLRGMVDINNDGNVDILGFNSTTHIVYSMLGNGDGTFASRTATSATAAHNQITYADFNNDGVIDYATHGTAVNFSLQLANTNETTTAQTFNLNTADGARAAISQIDATLDRIRAELGDIGSYQSRLQSSLNSLTSLADNFQAAASRITDVDVAQESATLIRQQILQQSGAAVLAQSNLVPQIALRLISG